MQVWNLNGHSATTQACTVDDKSSEVLRSRGSLLLFTLCYHFIAEQSHIYQLSMSCNQTPYHRWIFATCRLFLWCDHLLLNGLPSGVGGFLRVPESTVTVSPHHVILTPSNVRVELTVSDVMDLDRFKSSNVIIIADNLTSVQNMKMKVIEFRYEFFQIDQQKVNWQPEYPMTWPILHEIWRGVNLHNSDNFNIHPSN